MVVAFVQCGMEYFYGVVGGTPTSRCLVGNQAGIADTTGVDVETPPLFTSQGLAGDLCLAVNRGGIEW